MQPPSWPIPHPRRGVCQTCASCASCPCPTGPRCPPPAPGPGRAAPLPVRARRAEGGSGAHETPRREAGGRRAPGGAEPLTRRPRARSGRGLERRLVGERPARRRERGPTARAGCCWLCVAAPGGWRWHCSLRAGGGVRGPSPGPTAQCPFSLAGFLPSPSLPFFLSPSLPSLFSPSLGLPHRPHLLSSFFLSFFHPSSFPDSSLLSHCSLLPSSLY